MNELISKTFTLLRFPLMIGVVMIHCDITDQLSPNLQVQWAGNVMYLFSNVIGRFSVPMFFIISGFLFFRNGIFDYSTYISKLRNRVNTLLIPYLLWNLIGFLYFVIKHYPPMSAVFQGVSEIEISFMNFLKAFWEFRFDGLGETKSMPIDFPLWYIRDLIVVVVLSPLIYRLVKSGIALVAALGLLWFVFNIELVGIEMTGFFFFSLGAYFAVNKIDIAKAISPIQIAIPITIIAIVSIIIDITTRGTVHHHLIHKFVILMGIIMMFMWTAIVVKMNKSISLIYRLAPATFFVYALHGLYVATLRKGLCMVMQPTSNVAVVGTYILCIILTILLGLICYYILKRFCPSMCRLLNGGR